MIMFFWEYKLVDRYHLLFPSSSSEVGGGSSSEVLVRVFEITRHHFPKVVILIVP